VRHRKPSDLAGERVTVDLYGVKCVLVVEDWADRVDAAQMVLKTEYVLRAGGTVPDDNEVLYGTVVGRNREYLVHRCEVRR
jgi:hypothetical protein